MLKSLTVKKKCKACLFSLESCQLYTHNLLKNKQNIFFALCDFIYLGNQCTLHVLLYAGDLLIYVSQIKNL